MTGPLIRTFLFTSIVCFLPIIVGCSKMSGTYSDAAGTVTINFDGSKAVVNIPPVISNQEMSYDINGDQLILRPPSKAAVSQSVVLTIQSDGSLSGPPPYETRKKKA